MTGLAGAVRDRALRTPDLTAVRDGSTTLTYAQLDSAAAAVAGGLIRAGVRPGQAVALAIPRSWRLIVAMLGALRAGATVVPLDAQSPPARQRHVLSDSGAVAVVRPTGAEPAGVRGLDFEDLLAGDGGPLEPAADVAFTFYTSGTTGLPKGVRVRGAGIARLARPGWLPVREGARYACLSNPAFDAISFEVWRPLLTGGCCVVLDDAAVGDPRALADALVALRIDVLWMTSSLFNAVLDAVPDCFSAAEHVVVGGEQLDARVIRRWYRDNPDARTRLHNGYGPTECTTFAVTYPIPREFAGDVVPIGHPLPGTGVLVVDGELHLSGDGLAEGYQNRPQETEDRFVLLEGERFYRTGDLVLVGDGGLLTYAGRVDRQVKVRGFRVEPGEVERALTAHPAVRHAHVAARRPADGGPLRLLAWLVTDAEPSFAEFTAFVAAHLPDYLRPHHLHLLDALPLTANGKVDEAALLARTDPPWRDAEPVESADDPLSREVLALAASVLGVPDLDTGDRWMTAGGDSLAASRLRFAIRRRFGRDVDAETVLRGRLADVVAAVAASPADGYPPLVRSEARRGPATTEQQRLWLAGQRDPDSTAYVEVLVFAVPGPVDADALHAAVAGLTVRHAALRTALLATPVGLEQSVDEPYDPWTQEDPATREQALAVAERMSAEPFDLSRPRMLRAHWVPDPAHGGVLVLAVHHVAIDGWSVSLLLQDITAAYSGRLDPSDPGPGPIEVARWQATWFDRPEYRERRARVAARHADTLPEPEPLVAAPAGGHGAGLLVEALSPERQAALRRLGEHFDLTRFELLHGLFATALWAVTGQDRPRLGAPVANRPMADVEHSVGMFANTVLLDPVVAPAEPLAAQLPRLAAEARPALADQDVALAHVLDDRPGGGAPPFDALVVLENTDFAALAFPGGPARPLWIAPAQAKCPITLFLVDRPGGTDLLWEYDRAAFTRDQVAALADVFGRALDADATTTTPTDLAAPYRRSLSPSARPADARQRSLADTIARQALEDPDAPAVTLGEVTLDRAGLDARSAVLAAELRDRFPVTADAPGRVALLMEPSIEHVVALVALARLGRTAVPLDPAYPPALLRQVIAAARPDCVLVAGPDLLRLLDDLTEPGADPVPHHTVRLEPRPAPAVAREESGRPLYVLFTSGSTGAPKGVQVPEWTLTNLLGWQAAEGGLGAPAVTQQFSMLSFDVSFQEVFGTLCTGGHLRLVRPAWRRDVPALLEQLETGGVERLHLPYVALALVAEHGVRLRRFPSRLRDVVVAGEQLVCTDAVRAWFAGMPGSRLHNHYGPTETHVVSALTLDGDPATWPHRPAIGHPVTGAVLRVVDGAGLPVPPGRAGRLLLGGPMVNRCYLDDPDRNRDRFTEQPDGLFHDSGDRVRLAADGMPHFLGRDDDQVKLAGHRLELGQVEAALLRHPAVTAAAVALEDGALAAALSCSDPAPTVEELSAHLAGLLPAHVRIARYRRLDQLPRTPSGKLDRSAAVRAAGAELPAADVPAAARTPTDGLLGRLATIFTEVTGAESDPDRGFFDLGASSLDLMRFHLRCTADLPPDVTAGFTIADLFEHVTLRALAAHLDPSTGGAGGSSREAPAAVPGEPIAVVGMAVRLPGAADLAAFWEMTTSGRRGIEEIDAPDGLVGARAQLDGPLAFDPAHFGISRGEARLMDPQQRHLLMCSAQALAHAGIADPADGLVGLVAGCGENTYYRATLREADPARLPDDWVLAQHHDKDFLATKAAFHLGLRGPALTVQAACATSLVAVHVAANLLRAGDAEVMLAGGVLVDPDLTDGYRYRPGHILSPDGHCRSFSDDAAGTVAGSGVGVVVLKPLAAALWDGDTVYAVVTGSAVTNDGADKLGYNAPGVAGQHAAVSGALARAGRTGADIGYVEAHGTATRLGDPVEVAALRRAFGDTGSDCALSAVKSQVGHLGAAAGVVGLVRAVLAVHHGLIPPTADFRAPNPECGVDLAPFHVPTVAEPWREDRPRIAGVSSFGIGGANAHVVVERAPASRDLPVDPGSDLVLSASSAAALRADATRIAAYLDAAPDRFAAVRLHLRFGRPTRSHRIEAHCADASAAVAWLRAVAADDDVTTVDAGPTSGERPRCAPAPWDFPPPAFDLSEYTFPRAAEEPATEEPTRLPETSWLHQPRWVRTRRAAARAARRGDRTLVLVTDDPVDDAVIAAFAATHARVVPVHAVDPTDVDAVAGLLAELADNAPGGVDWVHATALGVTGPVGRASVARARTACVDAPAALLAALARTPDAPALRAWWLTHGSAPVDGPVHRPELRLMAGIAAVGPQEGGPDAWWVDLPGPELGAAAGPLAALIAGADGPGTRLALRANHWWHEEVLAVPSHEGEPDPYDTVLDGAPGDHVVLGGTGGIGTVLARWLLEHTGGRVVLLSRRPVLPAALAPWADRVTTIAADLTAATPDEVAERIAAAVPGALASVVHAAGVAAGSLIARRDPAQAAIGPAAPIAGALLVERLIARYRPRVAVYCSSMSARLGGVGQLDYSATAGLLSGFAGHRATPDEVTARIGVDWDVWRESGMAVHLARPDARHRAHLAVGLTDAEGARVFARALDLALPELLVSVTDRDEAHAFYAPPRDGTADDVRVPTAEPSVGEALTLRLRDWLGLDELDPDVDLYDLGADSLTLLDLIDVATRLTGVELDVSELGHAVTLTGVLRRLTSDRPAAAAPADGSVALETWRHGTGREVVCLVHPVGGDVLAYRPLVAALGPTATVCLIADPALRSGVDLGWSIDERARRYHAALRVEFPDRPLRLAGWSFGAWVALGIAAEAEQSGAPAVALHLIDPPSPGAVVAHDRNEEQLAALFADELGSAGADRPDTADYAHRLARCCRANLAAMVEHHPPKLLATPTRLWLATAPEHDPADAETTSDREERWAPHLPKSATTTVDTTHYGIVRAPHARSIAAALDPGPAH
ncbi:AMP-binding protein [Umezawaea sp. Da 62-37]|uniref:AMP-binding protein n=1 Tax=Umezawaea sp. Da 62-37 TaxID=3075927 RepID=UPI0028F6C575|nr:AMP-binding protein [Umezawaea sp. Da 62-37]WNV88971.1 AMP-binding protein [Umezawaea sp. Da 62-37]